MSIQTKEILKLTDKAADRVKEIMGNSVDPIAGLRITVKSRGCSGKSYDLAYVKEDEINTADEIVTDKGVKVYVEQGAVLFIVGTVMDFKEDAIASSFIFTNPNEKGRCGCGESFHV